MSKKKGAQAPLTPDKAVGEFIKRLDSLERSYSTSEKFRDLMEMAYCAQAKLTTFDMERRERLEERYMQIVNRYPNKDTIRAYPEILAIAMEAIAAGGNDFLGRVSSELAVLDFGKGQFFTPYEVSRMIAEMSLHDAGAIIKRDGYITLSEPACGSGGMVLAAADVLERMGFDLGIHMLVQAVDVSPLAYWMAFIQLSWRGIAAAVIRGNTLSLEQFESAWTPAAIVMFHQHHGHLSFEKPEPIVIQRDPIKPELAMLRWSAINRRWCAAQTEVITA